MEQNQENKSNTALKAGLILAFALAALFGFLYFNARQEVDQKNIDITGKTKELLRTNSKLDSIGTQLDAKIAEIQSLGGQVEELQKLKAQLEIDKKNLANSKTVSIKSYEEKIKGYEAVLKQKDDELAKLREENAVLTTQNTTLNTENTGLKTDVSTLKTEKTQLSDSVYSVSVKNKELAEKVTLAAALKAMNINVTAFNSRGKEYEGGGYKAKWVDKLKIFFKLAENPLTKKEDKTVYMRLLDPMGNVVSDMATGSGTFQFGGKETVYTTKMPVTYDNSGQIVDMFYQRGAAYEKGKYTIELYSEGFRIGQGGFDVK
jgi:predicted nuclease with TOPRIM domain